MSDPTQEDFDWMTDRALQLMWNGTPKEEAVRQAAREGQERVFERTRKTKQLGPGLKVTLADLVKQAPSQRSNRNEGTKEPQRKQRK